MKLLFKYIYVLADIEAFIAFSYIPIVPRRVLRNTLCLIKKQNKKQKTDK